VKRIPLSLVTVVFLALAGVPAATQADTLTTLYDFHGSGDGVNPRSAVILGTDGNLYGTTYGGGLIGAGTVFSVTPQGTLNTIYNFSGTSDGAQPLGALVQGFDGRFYGTTYSGGLASNAGTIFSISSTGMLTTIYRFGGGGDGGNPYGGLVQGSDSNFYGTTSVGGLSNAGTVFVVSPAGSLFTLYDFSGGMDGANPEAGLAPGPGGRYFGTTYGGGANGLGTIFRITTGGVLNPLYSFTGGGDGANPAAGLVQGNNGNFYGTTVNGGAASNGAVFEVSASGNLTALYNFSGGNDGAQPVASLLPGSDGNFYGTTSTGGSGGAGTVFKMAPGGNLTTLHGFGGADGAGPESGLVQSSVTNFYGTTSSGGRYNAGTVYSLLQPCAYALSSSRVTLPAIADSGTFNIATGLTNCPWTASNSVDWITITSAASGLGDGTIGYSVAANTSATARIGGIYIADKIFIITQQAQVLGQFLAGAYNGLVLAGSPSQAGSGFFTLVLGKTGAYQAELTLGGERTAFKGTFNQTGNIVTNIVRHNLPTLQVSLQLLDVTNQTDQITGTVSNGVVTSDLLADLAIFSRVNPCPFAGRYTFVLAPADVNDTTVPQGYGYGTLTVTTLGEGQLQGVLGDGTKIAALYPVSAYGTWPLFASLYSNQGSCLGLVSIASNALSAPVNWFRPAEAKQRDYPGGFATAVTMDGSVFVPGRSVTNSAQLTLGGGNLASNLVKNLTIDARGNVVVSPPGSDKLALKINLTSGQFSGDFVDPAIGKAPARFSGQWLQDAEMGAGWFQGSNQTGFVTIEPAP